ncbi:MAG: response regulator transcription factor [Bacteroidia bacterium]|nr:response regulator transcription factor [Bacteroidia bacterium]
MNVLIIEDEKLSAEHLVRLLERVDKSIQVLAQYDSVKKSVQEIKKGVTCDLLFVDIHLGDGISFEIFKQVKLDVPIIFTTAFDEYAIQAFKLNSIDYLLKPIALEDLKSALEKFKRLKPVKSNTEAIFSAYHHYSKPFKNRFMVKMGETISSVKAEAVAHFVSEEGLVLLVTEEGRRYPIDFTLDQLESLLSPELFFRINRKTILNINAIQKVSTYFNNRLKIQANALDEEAAVVSRERVGEFKSWLDR